MKIVNGTARKVFVFEKIVIKLPRIYWYNGFRAILLHIKCRNFWNTLFRFDSDEFCSMILFLFRGMVENYHERKLYKQTKMPILVQTYFSLCGFINVQKRVNEIDIDEMDHWVQLVVLTKDGIWGKDPHAFVNKKNFANTKDKIQIMDYGSPKSQKALIKFGDIIYKEYKMDFNRKEYIRDLEK
jgi:hypothetical protein